MKGNCIFARTTYSPGRWGKNRNMKTQIRVFLIVIIVSFILGCSKDRKDNLDPQIPGEYFPAFPKTWWEYQNYNNKIIKYEISDKYEVCEEKLRPVFLNADKCIQGASIVFGFNAPGTWAVVESPIYSLDIDREMVCPFSFSTLKESSSMGPPVEEISFRRVLIKKDTNLAVGNINYDNVILVKEFSLHDSLHLYIDYFAKDIGLIKRDSIMTTDTTTIMILKDYYIGK